MTIRKLIIAILLFTVVSSCSKVLDKDPTSDLDGSERFKEIEDYEFSLLGTYALFRDADYYASFDGNSNAFVTLPDILTDNVFESIESLGNERVFSRWQYAEDEDQIEGTWLAAYSIISQANLTMRGIDNFVATDGPTVNRIKGQALAIRAMVHFDVLRYWVENYDRNSTSPGIPYISVYDYEQMPSRGTVKETYDHIFQDLHAASAAFSDMDREINDDGGRAYMDQDVVNALLARVHLYANQYDSAVKYAMRVINSYPLASMEDFEDIWTDASNAEVVWSVAFDAGQGQIGGHLFSPDINAAQYWPNPALLGLYALEDIRYDAYFRDVADDFGDVRTVVSKHMNKFSQVRNPDGVVNFKAFRTGEMYLIRAEAYARKGGSDALAMADLNTLRAARIIGYVDQNLTGTALINAIAVERRKELVAEGHRWFDLKRTTKTINRSFCSGFCNLPPSSRAWNWPIPQPEIDANPNIGPQNTGW